MTLVAVDVGGTNVRFAVADGSGLSCVRSMLCGDFPSLQAAFAAYLGEAGILAHAASVAVAGPVQDAHVDVTNNHWRFDKTDLLGAAGLDRLLVINDFTAQALAQTDPSAHGNLRLLDGSGRAGAPLLVIGPGTGLGVSALIPAADGYIPLQGEGGHVGFAPQDDAELRLLDALRAEVGHVSAEHLVSGGGLETIYRLQTGGGRLTAPEIGSAAIAGDGPEREAAMTMLGILGTVIADATLTMGCWRGVVIAGGIVAQLQELLAASPFADRFRHGGTMGRLLGDVPVWLSVDPHAGLRGAATAMETPALRHMVISA
ncbi:MAG: glucokinase [Candidatus Puniceispirillaceae bacterium]